LTLKFITIYRISSKGRIKSLNYNRTGKERLLKLSFDKNGYLHVSLCKNNTCKTRRVHQLVAEAFLEHTPCGYELVVNHINFLRSDNRVENLEIVTARENSNHKQIPVSSKYEGVCWSKSHNKWLAQIFVEGKNINLGYFDIEEEANQYFCNALLSIKNNTKINIKRKPKSSKYKGVSWHKSSGKWQVYITIDKKRNYIGKFSSELEAHEAYIKSIPNV
jgi:hypothetical protein